MLIQLFLALVLTIGFVAPGHGTPVLLNAQSGSQVLDRSFDVYADPEGRLSLEDILQRQDQFRSADKGINRGYTNHAIWLRTTLQPGPQAPPEWWLEIGPSFLDEVTAYLPDPAEPSGYRVWKMGDTFKYQERWLDYINFVFPITVEDAAPRTIYLRVRTSGLLIVNATVWTPHRFVGAVINEQLILGLYYGAWALVIVANLLYWVLSRPPAYVWWIIYIVTDGAQTLVANGLAFPLLMPNHPELTQVLPGISLALAAAATSRFMIELFQLRIAFPRWAVVLRTLSALAVICGALICLGYNVSVAPILQLMGTLVLVLGLAFSAHAILYRGGGSVYYAYFVAFLLMNFSIIVVVLRNLGLLAPTFFVSHLWQINLLIHVILTNYGVSVFFLRTRGLERRAMRKLDDAAAHEQFVAMISHELRTPIATIEAALSNLTREASPDSPERSRRYQSIHRALGRMKMLVANYLAQGQAQAGNFHAVFGVVQFDDLLRTVVIDIPTPSARRRVNLAQAGGKLRIQGDMDLLRSALANVIDNALKYSGPNQSVSVRSGRIGSIVRISVRDQGHGIPPEELEQIFEPHYRASGRASVSGAGLGLPIVKRIIDLHHGNIQVSSTLGWGTVVTIELPCEQAET
ncbi:MAG: sensor histidine kinase [Burkholderiaceae bacterium]|nr:sensor histidine kinase [Burkholderiaceae bacterium]